MNPEYKELKETVEQEELIVVDNIDEFDIEEYIPRGNQLLFSEDFEKSIFDIYFGKKKIIEQAMIMDLTIIKGNYKGEIKNLLSAWICYPSSDRRRCYNYNVKVPTNIWLIQRIPEKEFSPTFKVVFEKHLKGRDDADTSG